MILDSEDQKKLLIGLVREGSLHAPVDIEMHSLTAELWEALQDAEVRESEADRE